MDQPCPLSELGIIHDSASDNLTHRDTVSQLLFISSIKILKSWRVFHKKRPGMQQPATRTGKDVVIWCWVCCSVMKFYFTTSTDSARTAGRSPAPLAAGAPIRNATKIRLARGSQSLTSWGKFWRILCSSQLYFVQPSATLIKVDFSLNLFFLSLQCFITDIFSSNIFVPFFICRPAQVLYSGLPAKRYLPNWTA